jgi:hypothetical protein
VDLARALPHELRHLPRAAFIVEQSLFSPNLVRTALSSCIATHPQAFVREFLSAFTLAGLLSFSIAF